MVVWVLALGMGRASFGLVVSEIMYHPVEDAVTQDETLEFIELYNPAAVSEDLGEWVFTISQIPSMPPDKPHIPRR